MMPTPGADNEGAGDGSGQGQREGWRPGFGLSFSQFFERDGLDAVDAAFLAHLAEHDAAHDSTLVEQLLAARVKMASQPRPAPQDAPDRRDEASLIFDLAAAFESFIARLFGIENEIASLRQAQDDLAPLVKAKWKFVKRQALLTVPAESLAAFDPAATALALGPAFGFLVDGRFDELAFAREVDRLGAYVKRRKSDPPAAPDVTARLDLARHYAAWAAGTDQGRRHHELPGCEAVIFRLPRPVLPEALIDDLITTPLGKDPGLIAQGRPGDVAAALRFAAGHQPFDLTDPGPSLARAVDEVHYCLYCQDKLGDTCSRGIRTAAADDAPPATVQPTTVQPATGQPATGQPATARSAAPPPASVQPLVFRRSPLAVPLVGCPLEERISEFQWLKARQRPLAALAVILIDNPMVAGTGHRICNDCVKACVFQSQTPVDIPAAETRTLRDILGLPWGVEIYGLLTRWNPLNFRQWLPLPASGYSVLVAGLGPAGYTLAHDLLNAGHDVFAVDALKIEPLPPGVPLADPIRDLASLEPPLSTRIPGGFGGVAEYGITARWNKNYLTLIRLLLERRLRFRLAGGVRIGSQFGSRDAFGAGFDHIALCLGAGAPRTLTIPNGLADGVRTASDFLMGLQLTGAARATSLANLQIRLPVVVIGGGLTAIDTATEALAYYAAQVEKFLQRHEDLIRAGVTPGWQTRGGRDAAIAQEFLDHALALRRLQVSAAEARTPLRLVECLQAWGGATIVYRRRLIDSPAYRLNHEELARALGEGVRFLEARSPRRFTLDDDGAVTGLELEGPDGSIDFLPVGSAFIAAGTSPNAVLIDEEPATFKHGQGGRGFAFVDVDGEPVAIPASGPKPAAIEVFVHREADGRLVSALGDLHPAYAGNVVRAMASARQGAIAINAALRRQPPALATAIGTLPPPGRAASRLDGLKAVIRSVRMLAPRVHEILVEAPLAARRFAPGCFYRLQNYETGATLPAMEGLALTGAAIDHANGSISLIVLDVGASSHLSRALSPGTPVVLMGPVGTPTAIGDNETVLLIGGGLGNAVLFAIGASCRARGSRVVYIAGYREASACFLPEAIEAAADEIIWCCETGPILPARRPSDRSLQGTIIDGLTAWADEGSARITRMGSDYAQIQDSPGIGPETVNRMIVIGSDRMMAAVARAYEDWLGPRLASDHHAIASINSPMQCMMKGVCGQCIQRLCDPVTGEERHVFTCGAQDQSLAEIDFTGLTMRLQQNSLQEKATLQWLENCSTAAKT